MRLHSLVLVVSSSLLVLSATGCSCGFVAVDEDAGVRAGTGGGTGIGGGSATGGGGVMARMTLLRGQLNLASGKYADAVKAFKSADQVEVSQLSTGQRKKYRGQVLSRLVAAQARLGKTTDAMRTMARLEDYAKANLSGPSADDATSYARGVLALARGEAGAAAVAMEKCSEPYALCHLARAEAQEAAGLTAAAADTRATLLKANQREAEYWFVHARLSAQMKESAM